MPSFSPTPNNFGRTMSRSANWYKAVHELYLLTLAGTFHLVRFSLYGNIYKQFLYNDVIHRPCTIFETLESKEVRVKLGRGQF